MARLSPPHTLIHTLVAFFFFFLNLDITDNRHPIFTMEPLIKNPMLEEVSEKENGPRSDQNARMKKLPHSKQAFSNGFPGWE